MNTSLYKLCIFTIKILPTISAIFYLIGTIFSAIDIDLIWLSYIGFTNFSTLILLLITSFAFKFCIWHRMPIYYIIINNIITYMDYVFFNPIPINWFIIIQLLIAGIFFIFTAILKYKNNGHKISF